MLLLLLPYRVRNVLLPSQEWHLASPLRALEKPSWPGLAAMHRPDLKLTTENRTKGLVSVSSNLTTDQKSMDLTMSPTCWAADFSIPITKGDVANQETSPKQLSILSP